MAKYRLGRGSRKQLKRRAWRVVSVLIFVGFLAVSGLALWLFMNMSTDEVTQPQTITHEYVAPVQTGKLFEEANFSMRLPDDWKLVTHDMQPYDYYKFQATEKGADNRWLEMYTDKFPTNVSVNRLLPVRIEEGKAVLAGGVSDNCSKFTDGPAQNGVAPSKWAEVSFNCDMARTSQNRVGVGALEQGQHIKLGAHTYLIIYTDHNISPDYQIIEDMMESFTAK